MDLLRSCYRVRMRFDPATDRSLWVQWYFAPPRAIPFPGNHCFSSLNWTREESRPGEGIGEQASSARPYVNGAGIVGATGRFTCGTPALFRTGAPYLDAPEDQDVNGLRVCCSELEVGLVVGLKGRPGVAVGISALGTLLPSLSESGVFDALDALASARPTLEPGSPMLAISPSAPSLGASLGVLDPLPVAFPCPASAGLSLETAIAKTSIVAEARLPLTGEVEVSKSRLTDPQLINLLGPIVEGDVSVNGEPWT